MENVEIIIQLVNGLGFPIFVSIALFYTNLKQGDNFKESLKDISKVIENNTDTIKNLSNKIERIM